MVVEVFIAKADSEDTLSEHCFLLMNNEKFIAGIWDAFIYRINDAETFINFPQKQCAGIGSEAATVEICTNFFGTET